MNRKRRPALPALQRGFIGIRRALLAKTRTYLQYLTFAADLRTSIIPTKAEAGTTATFTRATTATVLGYASDAVSGASQVVLSVASGEARFKGARRVSEGVWSTALNDGSAIPNSELLGYLAEGARTNRCLRSAEFDNAAWVKTNVTVTANDAVAPDGTTTADLLTASAANGTVIQDLGVVASAAKAGGLWIRRSVGTGTINLTLDGGTGWTAVTVTTSWTRVEMTQTLADEDFGIRIVTNADAVWVWGGQVETAAFLSSDIPTTTAAVTRNADALTYVKAGNVNDIAGTAYAEITVPDASTTVSAFTSYPGSGGGSYLDLTAGDLTAFDGTATRTLVAISRPALSPVKIASAWGGSSVIGSVAGSNGIAQGFDGDMSGGATTSVGYNIGTSSNNLYGTVRNLKIYNRALPNTLLQAMTT